MQTYLHICGQNTEKAVQFPVCEIFISFLLLPLSHFICELVDGQRGHFSTLLEVGKSFLGWEMPNYS